MNISNKTALSLDHLHGMIKANDTIRYEGRYSELIRTRNALLLKFLFYTAARRGELVNLRWNDIQQDGEHTVAVLRETKSGCPQRLKIRSELCVELGAWYKAIRDSGVAFSWIFVSLGSRTLGSPMTGKGINDVVRRLGAEIGIPVSAHTLRHTAITQSLELGEPLHKVQAYARHASANTTIRYWHDRNLLTQNPTDKLPVI